MKTECCKSGGFLREREKVGDCQILRPTVIHDTGSRAFIVQRWRSIVAMLILACNPDLGRRKCIFFRYHDNFKDYIFFIFKFQTKFDSCKSIAWFC